MPVLDAWTGPGMKAEMMPDWLLTGNIWQMICGLATGGGDRVVGTAGRGAPTTWAGVEAVSEQDLGGLVWSGLEASSVGAWGARGGGGGGGLS